MNELHEITKGKLRACFEYYKREFPDDYKANAADVKVIRDNLKNKYGDLTKNADVLIRHLYEWPEVLHGIVTGSLTDAEKVALFSDPQHTLIHWVARTFPEFRITSKV